MALYHEHDEYEHFVARAAGPFVEEQVSNGGYSTASEYLRELIREARRRKERQELEAKLLAGLQSPTSEMTADDWTALRERILARSPELRGEG
jgi:antitoxin ParD1/3/4